MYRKNNREIQVEENALQERTFLSGYLSGYWSRRKRLGADNLHDGQLFHELYKKMELSKTQTVAVDAGYKTPVSSGKYLYLKFAIIIKSVRRQKPTSLLFSPA